MARCLRCGAGGEWIEGRVPSDDSAPAGWVRIVRGHSGPVAADVEWQAEKPDRKGTWKALYFKTHKAALIG